MRILWVTSCAVDMWAASGRELLKSFLSTRSEGDLLFCTEGFILPPLPEVTSGKVLQQDIADDPMLLAWLEQYSAYIPHSLGGAHNKGCQCPEGPFEPHSTKHILPCVGSWFCKNAFRWFRKIVSLATALSDYIEPEGVDTPPRHYDCLIWLDADCAFKARVTQKNVKGWFNHTKGVFYLKNKRPVLESGIVGFHLENGASGVLQDLIRYFMSGFFLREKRWDDSWGLQKVLSNHPGVGVDLAYGVGGHSRVVEHSALGPFLTHEKGRHGRELKIMT